MCGDVVVVKGVSTRALGLRVMSSISWVISWVDSMMVWLGVETGAFGLMVKSFIFLVISCVGAMMRIFLSLSVRKV